MRRSSQINRRIAVKSIAQTPMSDSEFDIAEEDELLMHTHASLPEKCKKFWKKRYLLFSKFDEGVYLTSELWYSVTPEATARFTAKLVKKLLPDCKNVLDICCGGGGNTIQFAEVFESVGGIDVSANNLVCSKHNSAIYGVEEKTWFVLGDWNQLSGSKDWVPLDLPDGKFDFVFCSPPWGGPDYKRLQIFDLHAMQPFGLRQICHSVRKFTDNFGLFLPRTLDLDQLREVTHELYGDKCKTRVVYVWENGLLIGILAIFGHTYEVTITQLYEDSYDSQYDG